MKNSITKEQFDIHNQLLPTEEIIWQGKPQKKFTISVLESGGHYDGASGFTNALTSIIFFTAFFSCLFYMKELYVLMVLIILSGIGMIIIPEILKSKRRKQTEYLITSERIIFKLWWYGKTSFHSIHFNNLKNLIVAPKASGEGTIYLICKRIEQVDFTTYDFKDGGRRQQPTLELIKDCENVGVLLQNLIKKNSFLDKSCEHCEQKIFQKKITVCFS